MNGNDKRYFEELFVKQTEQFQQYVSVIAEGLDHKLALLAEGHQTLSEKMDGLQVSHDRLSEKVDRLELNLGNLAMKHDKLAEKVDRVESSLSRKIDRIASELAAHRADTEAHPGVYRIKET